MEPVLSDDSLNEASQSFQLKQFTMAVQATQRCWSEGVFLLELFPKFYKLYVQILLRLSQWIHAVLALMGSKGSHSAIPTQMKKSNLLVALHSDIHMLLDKLSDQEQNLVLSNIKTSSQFNLQQQHLELVQSAVAKSFNDLRNTFSKCLLDIQRALIDNLIQECGPDNVRQVNDLPRLYRKTNREVPTRCSSYVEQMLKPLKTFNDEFGVKLQATTTHNVLQDVLNKITTEYVLKLRQPYMSLEFVFLSVI